MIDNLPVVIAHKVRRRNRHMEFGLDVLVLHHLVILAQGIQDDTNERNATEGLCPGRSHELGERRCRMDNDPVVRCWVRDLNLVPVVDRSDRMYNRSCQILIVPAHFLFHVHLFEGVLFGDMLLNNFSEGQLVGSFRVWEGLDGSVGGDVGCKIQINLEIAHLHFAVYCRNCPVACPLLRRLLLHMRTGDEDVHLRLVIVRDKEPVELERIIEQQILCLYSPISALISRRRDIATCRGPFQRWNS